MLLVTDALEALGVTYCVGGSFASSTYGEPRATRDVDNLAALPAAKAGRFAARLEPEFFIQQSDLRDAIALATSGQSAGSRWSRSSRGLRGQSSGNPLLFHSARARRCSKL